MAPVARVAVEKTTCRFDKLFDYAIPQGMPLRPGVRVLVPFGHGRRIGLVVELAEQAAHAALKPIAAPLEEEPVLTEEGLFLLRWLRENTFCTWFDALSVLIPAGYGLRGLTGWSLVRGAPVPEDLSLTEQQVLFCGPAASPCQPPIWPKHWGLPSPRCRWSGWRTWAFCGGRKWWSAG